MTRRYPRGALALLVVCLAILVAVPLRHASAERDLGARPAYGSSLAVAAPAPPRAAAPSRRPLAAAPSRRPSAAEPRPVRVRPRTTPPPVTLEVEGLGVRATVTPVGVGADGLLELPPADRVGWYSRGSSPGGGQGSAVLAGHVDSRTQGRGVLFPLQTIRPGDRVRVGLAGGAALDYEVVAREWIPRGRLPVRELFARDGPPRLTVITCGGEYDPERGGYQDNVVVTAVPVRG